MLNISEVGTIYANRDKTDKKRNLATQNIPYWLLWVAVHHTASFLSRTARSICEKEKIKNDGLYTRITHGYTNISSILRCEAKDERLTQVNIHQREQIIQVRAAITYRSASVRQVCPLVK